MEQLEWLERLRYQLTPEMTSMLGNFMRHCLGDLAVVAAGAGASEAAAAASSGGAAKRRRRGEASASNELHAFFQ
jgi:hypothetical protein